MPPPRIIEHPMDVELPVTQTAMFACVGQGYGYVDVMWFRGNRDRSPPGSSTVTTENNFTTITSILTIPDVNDYTPSRYRCRYSNNEGETNSNTARLSIEGKYC